MLNAHAISSGSPGAHSSPIFTGRPNKTVDMHQQQKHLLMQALFQ